MPVGIAKYSVSYMVALSGLIDTVGWASDAVVNKGSTVQPSVLVHFNLY